MDKDEINYCLVDNIMDYLKFQLLDELNENSEKFPVFNIVLALMNIMNKEQYSYTLKDIDELLFEKLITEIIHSFTTETA